VEAEGRGRKECGREEEETEGREEKGMGAYRDEGPLTKILNMPLESIPHDTSLHTHCFCFSHTPVNNRSYILHTKCLTHPRNDFRE